MRIMEQAFMRWAGITLMLLSMGSVGLAQSSNEQQESVAQQPSAPQDGQIQPDKVNQEKTSPTAEGSSATTNGSAQPASAELPQSPSPKSTSSSSAAQETQGQQPLSQQNSTRKPIGSAAAEKEKTTGVAASNPAGVAIAPAKQGRSRAFFIKVGAVLGAGVAVGTAMALSRSSPSRPPGSH